MPITRTVRFADGREFEFTPDGSMHIYKPGRSPMRLEPAESVELFRSMLAHFGGLLTTAAVR